MSLNIKDQIICLLKENHSDWHDSINIDDYDVIVPMLESFHQYELIEQYTQLLEADDKLDLDQQLSQAGLKMAKQKPLKNQHQLSSDKLRRLDKSLEKMQAEEIALRNEIKSYETLVKGKSSLEHADMFEKIVDLRHELGKLVKSIAKMQAEKTDLVKAVDSQQTVDKPEYKRTDTLPGREKLSSDEVQKLSAEVDSLKQQKETADEQLEKLNAFMEGNPLRTRLMQSAKNIEQLKRNLSTYKDAYSDAVYTMRNPQLDVSEKKKEDAKKAYASLPDIISSTEKELNSLIDKHNMLLNGADDKTRNALNSLVKVLALKANIEDHLKRKTGILSLDAPGEKVNAEPVKIVGQDLNVGPLPKQTVMTQFRSKLSELSKNFGSMWTNAEQTASSGTGPYDTVGGNLIHLGRAFYGDQPESNDSRLGARFKNNPLIGTGRDLVEQLTAFIRNELSKGNNRETNAIYDIAKKYKFSNSNMSAKQAFIHDTVTLYNLLSEIKTETASNKQNLRIGREFQTYIDETLAQLSKFKSATKDFKEAFEKDEYVAPDTDIDDVTVHSEMSDFNRDSVISILKLLNTFGSIPAIGKYPQLVAHIKHKVERLAQHKDITKSVSIIEELMTQIASAINSEDLTKDEKYKSVQSLISAINGNRRLMKFVRDMESEGKYYIMPNGTSLLKGDVNRLLNKYRNGKGTFHEFRQEILNNVYRQPKSGEGTEASAREEKAAPEIKSTRPAARSSDFDPSKKDKSWNKLSIKK